MKLFAYMKLGMDAWFTFVEALAKVKENYLTKFALVLLRIFCYTLSTPIVFVIGLTDFFVHGYFLKRNHDAYLKSCEEVEKWKKESLDNLLL